MADLLDAWEELDDARLLQLAWAAEGLTSRPTFEHRDSKIHTAVLGQPYQICGWHNLLEHLQSHRLSALSTEDARALCFVIRFSQ